MTARDFTHDPARGMDILVIADQLAAGRGKRIKYIIANALILDTLPGHKSWKWFPYSAANPHRKHLHLSVMDNASCDDPTPWNLPMFAERNPQLRQGSRDWGHRRPHQVALRPVPGVLALGLVAVPGSATPGRRPVGTRTGRPGSRRSWVVIELLG